MKFGIVGYGRFGKLWANVLTHFGEVFVYDKIKIASANKNFKISTLPEVAQTDILFILTPIAAFAESCIAIKNHIHADTLIVDCCSVKIHPVNTMKTIFAKEQPLLATHPLFGPDSVKRTGSLAGHKIVICPLDRSDNKISQILKLFKQMELCIEMSTPEEHDKQMAHSQGLVHFLGRGLAALNIQQQALATPDFQSLLNMNNMVVNDSWQLFLDMHRFNPFTQAMRERLLQQLHKLDDEVNKNGHQ